MAGSVVSHMSCQQSICLKCRLTIHENHLTEDLSDSASKTRQLLKGALQEGEQTVNSLQFGCFTYVSIRSLKNCRNRFCCCYVNVGVKSVRAIFWYIDGLGTKRTRERFAISFCIYISTRHHHLANMTDPEGRVYLTSKAFCTKHQSEEITFFCIQCQQSICLKCRLTIHENHLTEDLSDSASKTRQLLKGDSM
jgi:hypothetical protein